MGTLMNICFFFLRAGTTGIRPQSERNLNRYQGRLFVSDARDPSGVPSDS